jgi:lipoprotein-releasing system ATP-binding protein
MRISSMSKVQSPKSVSNLAANIQATNLGERISADIGLWNSDLGLVVTNLKKSFSSPSGESIEVLRGVSFSVSAGASVAILGASGAGKSTLLHLLGGLDNADEGAILLSKFDISRATPSSLSEFRCRQIGFVFQVHHLLPDLSAVENVALPLMIARFNRVDSLKRATDALYRIGLDERALHPVGHLSGGEQQRVSVARALITEPGLLLADEPTGNLDTPISEEIGLSLTSYSRERRAIVVLATHNKRLATLCDRILVLKDGTMHEIAHSI